MALPDSSEAADIARRMIRRLHRLPEPEMREAVLAERLCALPSEGAVAVMFAMVHLIRPGELSSTLAMHALSEVLGEMGPIEYERRADWYRAARLMGHDSLAKMLLPREAKLKPPKTYAASDPVALYLKRPVPLGEKRFLARGKDKNLLERLLLDPSPLVVRNLLKNPNLTEEWVLRLATRRPAAPEILYEITDNRRWFGRYRVRLALARNPYTPTDLAIRCVPELQVPDLKDMAFDGTLHDEVQQAAMEELGRRRPDRAARKARKSAEEALVRGGGGDLGAVRRSAAGIRGTSVAEGFSRLGGDLDLVLPGQGLLEIDDPLAEGIAQLGDLSGTEDEHDDRQDDEELGAAEAYGEGHLVHDGPSVAAGGSEDQNEDVVQSVGPGRNGEAAQQEQRREEQAGEGAKYERL